MLVLTAAFVISLVMTMVVVRSAGVLAHLVHDHDLSGPQKLHSTPVPRVGGVGIVLGTLAGMLLLERFAPELGRSALVLFACGMPAFLSGLTEDLTKSQSPRRRLFFTAVSAALAVWWAGAAITRTDIPGLDWLVGFPIAAGLVTVFVVAGVANSLNIIDGLNGLASMCAVLILASSGYVGFQVGDLLVVWLAVVGVGAVLGFFVWNFPAGLVFLGDGGAYFLGFYVAEVAILLLARNPAVSPMFPLLVCIYPVFETVFSIYRRKMLRGQPAGMPDGIHLHSLIYRRIMRWAVGKQSKRSHARRNSMTSPYLWMLSMVAVVPAMLFWDSTVLLASFIVLFGVVYTTLYWRIVRFKSPRWMITKR